MAAVLTAGRISGIAAALFNPLALRSELLGSTVLPVYKRSVADADIGKLFFFEQRYFMADFGIKNAVTWRKHEKAKGTLKKMCDDWKLPDGDVIEPVENEPGFQTLMLSSAAMLGWMARLFRASFQVTMLARAQRIYACMTRFEGIAKEGFAVQLGDLRDRFG